MILDISTRGIPDASARVHGMADRARDTAPLWRNLAPVLVDAERRRFLRGFTKKTSGAITVIVRRPNAKRSQVTQRSSRRRYSLVETGRLRRSLTKRSLTATGGPDTVMNTSGDEMQFGTSVFYAKFLRKRGFKLIDLDRTARGQINTHVRSFLIGGRR